MPEHNHQPYHARAFGLRWASDLPLDQFMDAAGDGPADVVVRRLDRLADRPGGTPFHNGELFADGVRFRFGTATFDTFGGERVVWSAPGRNVPAAFYGTVTALILVWRGIVPLHGSAVSIGGKAVMIGGETGAGKSSLCDALVRRGGLLVSDDLTALLPLPGPGVPMLQPGRPAIRLARPGRTTKALVTMPMVDPGQPIPFAALAILRSAAIAAGPAEAVEAVRRQLFRPLWMRALPFRREQTATILRVAPRLAIFNAPHAKDWPDLSADDKASLVIERLRDRGLVPR